MKCAKFYLAHRQGESKRCRWGCRGVGLQRGIVVGLQEWGGVGWGVELQEWGGVGWGVEWGGVEWCG